jgi:hypothetical protein
MFVIHDKTLDLYRCGAGWVGSRAEADQFASETVAKNIARTLSAGHGRDIVCIPA